MPPKVEKGGKSSDAKKSDPARDALRKRLQNLQNVADPSGLKEAIRVLDLCNTDSVMLKIMEERVQKWENDVVNALPPEEREKFQKESRKALKGSDDDDDDSHEGGGGRGGGGSAGGDGQSRQSESRPRHDDDDMSESRSHQRSDVSGSRSRGGRGDDSQYSERTGRSGGRHGGGDGRGRYSEDNSNYDDDYDGGRRGNHNNNNNNNHNNKTRAFRDDNDDEDYDRDDFSGQSESQRGGGRRGGGGGGRRGGRGNHDEDDGDSQFSDRRRREYSESQPESNYSDQRNRHRRGGFGDRDSEDQNSRADDYYGSRRGGGGGRHSDDGFSEDAYYDRRRGGGGRRGGSIAYSDETGRSYGSEQSRYDDRGRPIMDRRRGGGNGGGRSRDMMMMAAPPGANEFRPVDKHVYDHARQRLVDFYSMVNPEKVRDVDKILEAYNGEEETLFRQLHLKYVQNLRMRLDPEQKAREEELLERARKLGTDLPAPPPPEEVRLEGFSVNDLLTRGAKLMTEAPEPPLVQRNNNNRGQTQQGPIIANDDEVVPALEALGVLTESNVRLAQEVAIAEQSVLQSRFTTILSRCLKSFNNSPNHLLVINDMHAGVEFQVALSDAVWAFLKEAVLDTPLIHTNSVRVTVSASHIGGVTQVDRNILASALREWSCQSPHTVAQRKSGGRWGFSTSRTAWWIWPSTPAMRDAVPAKSLIYPTVYRAQHAATNLNDASFPSLRDLISARSAITSNNSHSSAAIIGSNNINNNNNKTSDGRINSPNAALYDPSRAQPGYWEHFAHQLGVFSHAPQLSGLNQALQ